MRAWQSIGFRLFLITGLLVMAGCGSLSDDSTTALFPGLLTGPQVVSNPPVVTNATGTGSFSLSAGGLTFDITVDGLGGGLTQAHFHNAAAGSNDVLVRFPINFNGNTATGIWSVNDLVNPLTLTLVTALNAGEIYVDVHSGNNLNGEIRTQVVLTPEDGSRGFTAKFSGVQEVPPIAATARGTGAFVLNAAETELTFVITVTGLSGGGMTAAHFHNAPTGSNIPTFVRPLTGDFIGNTATGVWRNTDSEQLTPALVAALKGGNIYVNIHTLANGGGEIRGQVIPNL
ncbi:MAG: CHRD domain-containing protein [Nitrospira sp.]|nr:CHRD domain-containing protein [Candidatus Manganitrophaceae bacterium]